MTNPPRLPRQPLILDVPRFEQPDDVTCGPTCLAQVYRYYGRNRSVKETIAETRHNADGGTLAVFLGLNALHNGFKPTIYSYNLRIFDPTWRSLSHHALIDKLRARAASVKSKRLVRSLEAYIRFLSEGGRVRFNELDRMTLIAELQAGRPILTGLSATYLYRTPRERNDRCDDVRGDPVGHFVVICGYTPHSDRFVVRDPASQIPHSKTGKYSVPAQRLISAILLGDVTYDANLLVF